MSGPVTRIERLLDRCRADLTAHLATLRRVRAAEFRLTAATRMLDELRSSQRAVAVIRDAALTELADAGRSYAQLAPLAGLTRGRVALVVLGSGVGEASTDRERPGSSSAPNR